MLCVWRNYDGGPLEPKVQLNASSWGKHNKVDQTTAGRMISKVVPTPTWLSKRITPP
jgi:hypothetical protein